LEDESAVPTGETYFSKAGALQAAVNNTNSIAGAKAAKAVNDVFIYS
jgi:hypothetical protein